MCGFTITKEKIENLISHRGIEQSDLNYQGWYFNFNSLPLSSYNLGLTQPLIANNYILCFNGEIFNYKELDPNSISDLHYLVRFINKKGFNPEALYKLSKKWEGFWSITLCDKKGDLWCFTDSLGKKQLYYSQDGVSSEIKPLIKGYDLLGYNERYFGTSKTPFMEVERFLPGKLYTYKRELKKPYLVLDQSYFIKPDNTSLYNLIDKAVKERVANRIDGVSLFLSGGLDSNIVLHHLIKNKIDVEILTIENDESEVVKKIANDFGLHIKYISDEFTEEDLVNAIRSYEHPYDLGSLIPNYLLFKNAKNSVVLTGDGADELFGGYTRAKDFDTFDFDVFKELPYYHNIRIDRLSMAFTKEARSPLMSNRLLNYAFANNKRENAGKRLLREEYKDKLPDYITSGVKKPLRLKNDKEYNKQLIKSKFKEVWQKELKKLNS